MIALSVAAILAVFLLYTSLAGGGTPTVQPSELPGTSGRLSVAGQIVGPVSGNARSEGGLRFTIRDIGGTAKVPVVYVGSVPDLFKLDQHVTVTGELVNGTFIAEKDTMIMKCPSRYVPRRTAKPPLTGPSACPSWAARRCSSALP
jgi:cytochrome c-type biogenesis protein CcmE